MGVYAHVGLAGSGKTIALARIGLDSLAEGRTVRSSFGLGRHFVGWQMPCCSVPDGLRSVARGAGHECELVFHPSTPATDAIARATNAKRGRGFLPFPNAKVLEGWDELVELRVKRDVFGNAHRDECDMVYRWDDDLKKRVHCHGCSKGIVVLLDELHGWAPAREYQKLPEGVFTRWSYTRKDGLDIHYSAQHESNIDAVIRRVTTHTIVHQKAWAIYSRPDRVMFGRFVQRTYLPSEVSERERQAEEAAPTALSKRGLWFDRAAAETYDTYERIAPSRHLSAARAGAKADASRRQLRVVGK